MRPQRNNTAARIEKRYRQQWHDASGIEMTMFYTCFALGMHRLYKFGGKRVLRLCHYVDDLYGQLCREETTLEKLKQELKDETGTTFDMSDHKETKDE